MKLTRLLFLAVLVIGISSCFPTRQIEQLTSTAKSEIEAGNTEEGLAAYEEIIAITKGKGKKVDSEIYLNAGLASWDLGDIPKAIDYLEKAKAKDKHTPKMYYVLSKAYLKIDNLSLEIKNLEYYTEKFPEANDINEINNNLFIAYVKSTNWQLAQALWPKLKQEYKEQTKTLIAYLTLLDELEKTEKAVKVAKQLLSKDSNNTQALEVLAQTYYRRAEDSYQKEMRAYEQNRTNRQYRQLLKALDVINENFKTARDYFERLYKLDPKPRYATYLGNIYTRFDNKQKAGYYYQKAKE
ncbi:MAG: tetratricopeptide repeat protein [Bacteroidales bacterium]